jgi:hypothetical protein
MVLLPFRQHPSSRNRRVCGFPDILGKAQIPNRYAGTSLSLDSEGVFDFSQVEKSSIH